MSIDYPKMRSLVTRLADHFDFDLRAIDGDFSVGVDGTLHALLVDVRGFVLPRDEPRPGIRSLPGTARRISIGLVHGRDDVFHCPRVDFLVSEGRWMALGGETLDGQQMVARDGCDMAIDQWIEEWADVWALYYLENPTLHLRHQRIDDIAYVVPVDQAGTDE